MQAISGKKSSESHRSGLRADAQQNRVRVLAAARDVFIEVGAGAPLDEIARRAGVGVATLYRRFPTRETLVRAVVLDVLVRSAEEARAAQRDEADPFQALARYMRRAIDLRISAVFPAVIDRELQESDEIRRARRESADALQGLLDAAQADGGVRSDVAFGDIGLLLVRLSRPLPGAFSREVNASLAHRHLEIALDGLRAETAHRSPEGLSGPVLDRSDLQSLGGGMGPSRQGT